MNIEVSHQSSQKLQKDLEIGQIVVPLKNLKQLVSKKEVRMVEELKHSFNNKVFFFIIKFFFFFVETWQNLFNILY